MNVRRIWMQNIRIHTSYENYLDTSLDFNNALRRKLRVKKIPNSLDLGSIIKYINYASKQDKYTHIEFIDDILLRDDGKALIKHLGKLSNVLVTLNLTLDTYSMYNKLKTNNMYCNLHLPTINLDTHKLIYKGSALVQQTFSNALNDAMSDNSVAVKLYISTLNIEHIDEVITLCNRYGKDIFVLPLTCTSLQEYALNNTVVPDIDMLVDTLSKINNVTTTRINCVNIPRCMARKCMSSNLTFVIEEYSGLLFTPCELIKYSEDVSKRHSCIGKCIDCKLDCIGALNYYDSEDYKEVY